MYWKIRNTCNTWIVRILKHHHDHSRYRLTGIILTSIFCLPLWKKLKVSISFRVFLAFHVQNSVPSIYEFLSNDQKKYSFQMLPEWLIFTHSANHFRFNARVKTFSLGIVFKAVLFIFKKLNWWRHWSLCQSDFLLDESLWGKYILV